MFVIVYFYNPASLVAPTAQNASRPAVAATSHEPKVEANLSVPAYIPNMEGTVNEAVHQLFFGPSQMPLPISTVVMGSVHYEDTLLGSPFGKRLEILIEHELSQVPQIKLIRRKTTRGLKELQQADRSRGLTITDRPVPPMSSQAMQAQLDGAQAALEAHYRVQGEQIHLDLTLVKAGTGVTLASARASMDKALIPPELQLMPPRTDFVEPPKADAGKIRLELTTHQGDGVTFVEREKITFYASTDQGAYLLLLYQDAAGQLVQIYPNARTDNGFHEAGEYIAIPGNSASFDFTITPPFGIEQVWAFAATSAFPTLKGERLDDGLKVLQEALLDVIVKLRAHGQKVSYGEANVVITTVKE